MNIDSAARAENIRLIEEGAGYLASADRLPQMRALRHDLPGFDRTDWARTAELGWLGLCLSEERGGIGFGLLELCAFAEQMGQGLEAQPLLAAILTVPLLTDEWKDRVLAGETIVLPALQEALGGDRDMPTLALVDGKLSGIKRFVHMGAAADAFVVATRDGFALVERAAPGLSVEVSRTQDGGHLATLRLDATPATPLLADTVAYDELTDRLTLATAAYLLGTMRRAFAITADYLGTRKQFDRPIGSFQSLQHRMVDLYVQIELTAASIRAAAQALEGGDARAGRLATSRAKARAADAAMLVTRQGVQLHGGIGYTDEADIGLYLRKAMTLANLYGGAAAHRARYAAATDLGDVQ